MITQIIDSLYEVNDHYAISENELRFVLEHAVALPMRPTVLELGVCHGRTLAALSLAVREIAGWVYGIDHFGLEGSALEVRSMLEAHRITNCTLIESDTKHVLWDKPIDLLVVDAGHDEANVRPDSELYVPYVAENGYVFWDDWPDDDDRSNPHWAVRFYGERACRGWEDLGQIEGMKGWRRRTG